MNKGLLAGALVQGLGNLASQTIQTRAANESEQTKFRRDVALETLKQSGAIQAKQAERLPLPLDNPAVQEHLALSIGTTVPQVQGLLDSMRVGPQPGQDFTPEQQKQMGELYKQISAALAGLDPKQAEAQKHMADTEGKTLETQITSDYLTNPGARPVISGYYSAKDGKKDEPFAVTGDRIYNKATGQYWQLPAAAGNNQYVEQLRLTWTTKQAQITQLQKMYSEARSTERPAIMGQIQGLQREADGYEAQLKTHLKAIGSPGGGNAESFMQGAPR